jgi:hypothetical protein
MTCHFVFFFPFEMTIASKNLRRNSVDLLHVGRLNKLIAVEAIVSETGGSTPLKRMGLGKVMIGLIRGRSSPDVTQLKTVSQSSAPATFPARASSLKMSFVVVSFAKSKLNEKLSTAAVRWDFFGGRFGAKTNLAVALL